MRYTVDRIEGDYAVLISDKDEVINVPLNELPIAVTEGNILSCDRDGELYIDYVAEAIERDRLKALRNMLPKSHS